MGGGGDGKKSPISSPVARFRLGGCPGELIIFHPVNTVAKRLVSFEMRGGGEEANLTHHSQ